MARTLILVSILLNCSLSVSQAQLFRGNSAPPAAREPARVGLLGGLREAREERFRREEQAAVAAARAAAAQRAAAANARTNPAQPPAPLTNNSLRRQSTPNTPNTAASSVASAAGQRGFEANDSDVNSRTSNYRGPAPTASSRSQVNSGLLNPNTNSGNTLSRPSAVTAASAAAFVPPPTSYAGRMEYEGPGVTIRLPKDAPNIVNYLVDDVETNAIRPGEQQVLDAKDSYVVRYSRGVTADGRTFGESRYTVTEGRYRFELTATGWELYRESDTDANVAPPNRLELADEPKNNRVPNEFLPLPSSQSELQRGTTNQPLQKPELGPAERVSSETPTEAAESVAGEEVLPAPKPRSILE